MPHPVHWTDVYGVVHTARSGFTLVLHITWFNTVCRIENGLTAIEAIEWVKAFKPSTGTPTCLRCIIG